MRAPVRRWKSCTSILGRKWYVVIVILAVAGNASSFARRVWEGIPVDNVHYISGKQIVGRDDFCVIDIRVSILHCNCDTGS
jgi:hypothetical protein